MRKKEPNTRTCATKNRRKIYQVQLIKRRTLNWNSIHAKIFIGDRWVKMFGNFVMFSLWQIVHRTWNFWFCWIIYRLCDEPSKSVLRATAAFASTTMTNEKTVSSFVVVINCELFCAHSIRTKLIGKKL